MREIETINYKHRHGFERVCQSFFRKFPNAKRQPEIVDVKTTSEACHVQHGQPRLRPLSALPSVVSSNNSRAAATEDKTGDDDVIDSERVCVRKREIYVQNTLPAVFRTLLGIPLVIFEEESRWFESQRVLRITSQNRTFRSFGLLTETSEFRAAAPSLQSDESQAELTLFSQTGYISCNKWIFGPFAPSIERWVSSTIRDGGVNSCRILDDMLNGLE